MSRQRLRDQRLVGQFYRKKFQWLGRCVYCGFQHECWDHVLPLSIAAQIDLQSPRLRREIKQGLNLVPCCQSCNRIAGAKPFFLIREKRAFIQERLRNKHRKYSRHVLWDDDEIADLGPNMRAEVIRAMNNRNTIESRLTWPHVKTSVRYRSKSLS